MYIKNTLAQVVAIYIAMIGIGSAAPQTSEQSAIGACDGISEKCTEDKPYPKKIGGKAHSCYDCKQAMCKDGGKGGLAGTKTESYCTPKATTYEPVSQDDLFRGKASGTTVPTENAPTDPVIHDHRSPKIDVNSSNQAEIVAPNNRTGTVRVQRTRPSSSSTVNTTTPIVTDHR
jgi:hypothetical protein